MTGQSALQDANIRPALAVLRRVDPLFRRRAIGIMVMLAFNGLLELVSIGAVLPLVAVLTAPGEASLMLPAGLSAAARTIEAQDHALPLLLAFILAAFALKALFQSRVAQSVARFANDLHAALGRQLLQVYLSQPFLFFKARNASECVQTVHEEAFDAAHAVRHLIGILAELVIVTAILGLLLVVSPVQGLVVGLLLAAIAALIVRRNRQRLRAAGEAYRGARDAQHQLLREGFRGIKEFTLLGRQSALVGRFERHSNAAAQARVRHETLEAMPRIWLELIAVAALSFILLSLPGRADSPGGAVPLLALYGAAAFRLMPSANRLVVYAQGWHFLKPTLSHVEQELQLAKDEPVLAGQAEPLSQFAQELRLDHVSLTYPGAATPVLRDCNMTIPFGTVIGIIGPSGSGKTSLLDMILGLIPPSSGRVLVDGRDVTDQLQSWGRQIGYVPQEIFLLDDTIRQNVALDGGDCRDERIDQALRQANLAELIATLPQGADTVVGEDGTRLSGGQRQRIGIARALANGSRLLVLDEATSALDAAAEAEICATVARLKGSLTVIIATHRKAMLALCDQVYRIERGQLLPDAAKVRTAEGA